MDIRCNDTIIMLDLQLFADGGGAEAIGIDYVDITHAIGGRIRTNKEGSLSSTRETGYKTSLVPTAATFSVNIADFLAVVNAS